MAELCRESPIAARLDGKLHDDSPHVRRVVVTVHIIMATDPER
jgi:hypothetical protein